MFGAEFALAAALPDLGFTLSGLEQAASLSPGVGTISAELLGTIEADTVLALGPADWRETPSAVVLSALSSPVLWVPLDLTRPSAGPLTSTDLLREYVEVLGARYGA